MLVASQGQTSAAAVTLSVPRPPRAPNEIPSGAKAKQQVDTAAVAAPVLPAAVHRLQSNCLATAGNRVQDDGAAGSQGA